MRVLVTGGAGFIGSHFVRRLVDAGDDVVVLDKLTYSGNPREPRGRRARVPPRRHRRPRRRVAEAAKGCDAVVNFAAETHVDRSILEAARVHPHGRRRHAGAARAGRAATAIRLVHVSTDEVYGDLEGGGRSTRGRPAAAVEPVQRVEGRRRPAGARVRAHVRRRRVHHARREHVRPEPVPREDAPALRHERARRPAAAGVRRRPAGARVAPRRGPLRRDRARAPRGRLRRDLQRRRRGAGEHRRHAPHPRAHRAPTSRSSRTSTTAPATTAATRSTTRSCARSAGRAAASVRRRGPRRDGRLVPRATAPGGSRSSRASSASTTSGSTPRGSP